MVAMNATHTKKIEDGIKLLTMRNYVGGEAVMNTSHRWSAASHTETYCVMLFCKHSLKANMWDREGRKLDLKDV